MIRLHAIYTRIPKGGAIGPRVYGGYQGGGGVKLPPWAKCVIILTVLWLALYVCLHTFFARRERYMPRVAGKRYGFWHVAWKSFKHATLIQAAIWAVRRCRKASDGRKKQGVYDKAERGQGRGPITDNTRVAPAAAARPVGGSN
ncbi:hypothetical protein F4779DRAFT_615269 [Xylariaceae sp. FL0662B]|nr:hypothetical protein F4779DRAFT_615269 [Xylariaceae sp. FL0662B]